MRPARPRWTVASAIAVLLLSSIAAAAPVETSVTVRVRSHDAKFIGSGVGGMHVVFENADTGQLLASGQITGATGDTERLISTPIPRGARLAGDDTAGFTAQLALERPTRVRIRAVGPLKVEDARQELSVTTWVVPGQSIDGDGIVLNLPGLIVDAPPQVALERRLPLVADVTLMCGCPITKGGLWDADDYTVRAIVRGADGAVAEPSLQFTGQTNRFAGEVALADAGRYEVTVWAHNAKTGNTGVAEYSVDVP